MTDNAPVVDYDDSADPASAFVEEECHVVFILTVEIFLIGERGVFVAFDKQGVVNDRDAQHDLVFGLVGDGEHGFVFGQEARGGELGERCAEHRTRRNCKRSCGRTLWILRIDVDINLSALGEPRTIDNRLAVAEGVVVVEPSVVVGDGEVEIVGKHWLARKMLKHDAECVGVFLQVERDAVGFRGRGVGKLDALQSVEQSRELCVGFTGLIASELAVEVFKRRFAGLAFGYVEVAGVITAPDEEVVASRLDLHGEFVIGGELTAVYVESAGKLAGLGIDCKQGDAVDFVAKGIGKFHIVVVSESYDVVAVDTVAVLKD